MPRRWSTRTALASLVAAALLVWLGSTGTLSSFTTAQLHNATDTVNSGNLALAHNYAGTGCAAAQVQPAATTSCPGSVYPAVVGGAGVPDTITNTGNLAASSIASRYRIAGCGVVQLANSGSDGGNGALLPRKGTTFAATGPRTGMSAVTLDGTAGYAASVSPTSEPVGGALLATSTYGVGVWFNTSDSGVDPLVGFAASATTGTGKGDRILYLSGGRIGFVPNTTATGSLSTGTYNTGTWHFAWVSISTTNVVFLGLGYSYTVYVDGAPAASGTSGLFGALSSYSGYWHLGWSRVGGTPAYFKGSLSDLVVDDSGNAPANPSAPATYGALGGTQQWRLDDLGGPNNGTTPGTLPSGTALPAGSDPCTYVNITWPRAGIATPVTLRAAATAGYSTAAAGPDPGGTQTSTIALASNAPNAYAVGLLLYAPVQATYYAGVSTSWYVSFLWSLAATTFAVA